MEAWNWIDGVHRNVETFISLSNSSIKSSQFWESALEFALGLFSVNILETSASVDFLIGFTPTNSIFFQLQLVKCLFIYALSVFLGTF